MIVSKRKTSINISYVQSAENEPVDAEEYDAVYKQRDGHTQNFAPFDEINSTNHENENEQDKDSKTNDEVEKNKF
jgi:hypothetical protein